MSNSDFVVCTIMSSEIEAQMFCNMLKAQGIDAHSRGTKEYASIITGNDQGRYEVVVPEGDLGKAKEIAANLNTENSQVPAPKVSSTTRLKRAYIFALCAMFILPVVFNIASLMQLRRYYDEAPSSINKPVLIFAGLLLNVPAVFVFYGIWGSWLP